MRVYTKKYNPWVLGGPTTCLFATEIDEYEVVDLGRGYFGIAFYNTIRKEWLIAEKKSGGVIGIAETKEAAVATVKEDMKEGTNAVIDKQIKEAKAESKKAHNVSNDEFFR